MKKLLLFLLIGVLSVVDVYADRTENYFTEQFLNLRVTYYTSGGSSAVVINSPEFSKETFSVDDEVRYIEDEVQGLLTTETYYEDVPIIGIERNAFQGCSGLKHVVIEDNASLQYIAAGAFKGLESLESVTFESPQYLTTIGDSAFANCPNLTTVTGFPASLVSMGSHIFANCPNLKTVTLESGVTLIPDYAFKDCTSLTTVWFGSGVTSTLTTIGTGSFQGCTSYTTFSFPTLKYIGNDAFRESGVQGAYLRQNLSYMGTNVFRDCTSLTTLNLSNCTGLTLLPEGTFQGCTGLQSLTFPSATTIIGIGKNCFSGCTGLTSIDFGAVTELYPGSFSNCTSLTAVTLPATVKAISYDTFKGCSSLATIYSKYTSVMGAYPQDITQSVLLSNFTDCASGWILYVPLDVYSDYLNHIYWSCYADHIKASGIGDSWHRTIDGITYKLNPNTMTAEVYPLQSGSYSGAVDIPSTVDYAGLTYNVTTINESAFAGNTAITSVTLPEGITEIPQSAFNDCTGLTTVTLPEGLTTIDNSAFSHCI